MGNQAVAASAPYARRPPSPPQIVIPPLFLNRRLNGQPSVVIAPSYENVDPGALSKQDLAIITGNSTEFVATNMANDWKYEQRRQAQHILDFLYLGPSGVIRDREYLKREGVSMIIVARDSRLVTRELRTLTAARDELGIEAAYVDIPGREHTVGKFPDVVRLINDHLLSVYHGQMQGKHDDGQMLLDAADFKRGKVLVTCESGNSLSAVLVAAYIMAVFGKDVPTTVQFINIQRFCVCFDEDLKRSLVTWSDILHAQAAVGRSQLSSHQGANTTTNKKRGLNTSGAEDEYGLDTDMADDNRDEERFSGRAGFAPFRDVPQP